jgi:Flp pilus assembly protein TadG
VNRRGRDDGSTTVELAILAPALLVLLALLVFAGRVETNASAIEQAARAAARGASLARTPDAARTTATDTATTQLATTNCVAMNVAVDTGGFAAPVGTDASVSVTVTCTIAMGDLAAPGIPGAKTLIAHATSPIDRYRAR